MPRDWVKSKDGDGPQDAAATINKLKRQKHEIPDTLRARCEPGPVLNAFIFGGGVSESRGTP